MFCHVWIVQKMSTLKPGIQWETRILKALQIVVPIVLRLTRNVCIDIDTIASNECWIMRFHIAARSLHSTNTVNYIKKVILFRTLL